MSLKVIKKKNILLLGTTGRLGRNIKKQFKENKNFKLITTGRGKENNVDIVCNPTKRNHLKDVILKTKPFAIINCIAITNVEECEINKDLAFSINCNFPKMITEIINEIGIDCKLIHISTDQIYKSGNWSVVGEEMPLNIYARSKLEGDKEVLKFRKSLILRTNFLWNDSQDSPVDWLISKSISKEDFFLFNDVIVNPVHVRFLAYTILKLTTMNVFGIYNIGSKSSLSKANIYIKIAKKLNIDITRAKVVSIKNMNFKAKRPKVMTMSVSHIERDTKILMPSIKNTLDYLIKK